MTAAAVASELVETRIGKIEVRRGGAGKPVVYLHSAAGEGAGLAFLDELASTREVFAPMFPGFGASEGIEQIDDMEDAVFHLLDLFDRLGLQAPDVMGLSLGGWLAAELATRYPDRLSKLILANPAGLYIEGAPIKDIFGRSPKEMAQDLFADMSHPAAQIMLRINDQMSDVAALGQAIPFELLKPQLQSMAATARVGWNPYLHNPKLRKRLARITAPTLVIRGEKDTLIPAPHCETYAREIRGAKLVEMRGVAHMVSMEQPAELAALVNDFLGS
jgi:pimeloyl-ACP methyl ester carboxylesterase